MMTIHAIFEGWLIASVLSLLAMVFLWLEWRRKYRFREGRIVAIVFMIGSLAGILLRPGFRVNRPTRILLLTPGYSSAKADSLLKTGHNLKLFHTPDAVPHKGSSLLPSYHELARIGNSLAFVLGDGIPTYALDPIPENNFLFIPSPVPEGVTALDVPPPVFTNRQSFVEGTFNNTRGVKWLYLISPGGKEDSVKIQKQGAQSFRLNFSPKQPGNLIYDLSVKDSMGIRTEGKIPISVLSAAPLNVLFLQTYPTFETRYLKDFLAQKNHKLVLRYQLSKNTFRFEYANRNPSPISKLSKDVLGEFDLMITDKESLEKLTASEKAFLMEAVQSGLGLLTILNKPTKSTSNASFFPFEMKPVRNDTTIVSLARRSYTLPALPVRAVYKRPLETLLGNKSGILSGYTFEGRGKLGFQLLQETYQLTLSGDSLAYGAIWSPLLEHLAKTKDNSSSLRIVSPFPRYRDEPIQLDLVSTHEQPVLLADSIQIPLLEDIMIDDLWHGRIWGDAPGWHILQNKNDTLLSLYIAEKQAWRSLSLTNRQKENSRVAYKGDTASANTAEYEAISPLWFFLIFIFSASFLWLTPKL